MNWRSLYCLELSGLQICHQSWKLRASTINCLLNYVSFSGCAWVPKKGKCWSRQGWSVRIESEQARWRNTRPSSISDERWDLRCPRFQGPRDVPGEEGSRGRRGKAVVTGKEKLSSSCSFLERQGIGLNLGLRFFWWVVGDNQAWYLVLFKSSLNKTPLSIGREEGKGKGKRRGKKGALAARRWWPFLHCRGETGSF